MSLTQTAIQDRMGLLQVSAINAAMSALMKTLTSFTKEKVIVNRERQAGIRVPRTCPPNSRRAPRRCLFPLAFGVRVPDDRSTPHARPLAKTAVY